LLEQKSSGTLLSVFDDPWKYLLGPWDFAVAATMGITAIALLVLSRLLPGRVGSVQPRSRREREGLTSSRERANVWTIAGSIGTVVAAGAAIATVWVSQAH